MIKSSTFSQVAWNGRLLALDEGSLPYELHKRQLTSTDHSTADGLFSQHDRVAPHTRSYVDSTGIDSLIFMSVASQGVDALLTFTAVPDKDADTAATPRTRKSQFLLPGAVYGMFHDFAVTQDYYVVYENPVRPNVTSAVTGIAGFLTGAHNLAQTFDFRTDLPCKIHLLPRPGSKVSARAFVVPEHMQALHHVNAFQSGASGGGSTQSSPATSPAASAGSAAASITTDAGAGAQAAQGEPLKVGGGRFLTLDSITHRHIDLHATLDNLDESYFVTRNRPDLMRFVLDLKTGQVRQRVLSHRACDFPTTNPLYSGYAHSCIFTPAAGVEDARQWGPNQCIMKLNVPPEKGTTLEMASGAGGCEIWSPGDMCFTQVRLPSTLLV